MSSHHIVRDEQEPALLVIDFSPEEITHLLELLEWSPFVIVHENALTKCMDHQFKFDLVLAKEKNNNQILTVAHDQHPFQILHYDEDPIEPALHYLIARKFHALNIVTMRDILSLAKIISSSSIFNTLTVNFIQGGLRHSLIYLSSFKKWLPAHTAVSIEPLGSTKCETYGESFTADQQKLKAITKQDGFIEVKATGPFIVSVG